MKVARLSALILFLLEDESAPGLQCGQKDSVNAKFIDPIGNRIHDLPACSSAVPRPTTPPDPLNAANPILFGSWFRLTQKSGLALSSAPSWIGASLAFYLMMETNPASETFCLILYCKRWTMGAVRRLSDWKRLFRLYFHASPCTACNDVMHLKHFTLVWKRFIIFVSSICTILSSVDCPALQYFSTLSHIRHDFRGKKILNIKVYFVFRYNVCLKRFSFY